MEANQKLRQFMAEVSRSTEQQIAELTEQTESECNAILAETQERCNAEAEREIAAARLRIDAKYKKRLSQVGYRGKTTLLSRRQSLLLGLFAELRAKLVSFAQSEDYLPWMQKMLRENPPPAGSVLLLRAADMKSADALREAAGTEIAFREDPAILLGGLSVLSADGRRCVNHTLDEAFSAQFCSFYRNHSIDGGNE